MVCADGENFWFWGSLVWLKSPPFFKFVPLKIQIKFKQISGFDNSMHSYTDLLLNCERSEQKNLAFFVYFIFEKNGFCKRRGGFNGVTILMWEFYWGTSKSQHFEWGVCRFFVIFNGVILSYEIPVGWVIFLLGWKNGPFSEIFFTGVTSGVDPTGSQRQGCPLRPNHGWPSRCH